MANQYDSQALGLSSTLAPALTAESINPQGYSPTTMGQMTTAAEQTAGGSNAGATGQAGLMAARTRNIGSGQATAANASTKAGENLSEINTGIQSKNADLKAKQQQAGLSGLEHMYGTDVGAGEGALGISNQSLSDAGNLKNFWQSLLTQGIDSGTKAGVAYMNNN